MEPTVEQLRHEASKTPVGKLQFAVFMWAFNQPSYDEWVSYVEEAVQFEVELMAERRNDLHNLDEDALSAILNIALQNLNMDASAKVVNGNTDITIQHTTYKWLGEAKFGNDVGKLYKGYLQLTARYSTGMPNQTAGGMLIYCNHDAANVALAAWRAALETAIPASKPADGNGPLTFRSVGTSQSTGIRLDILHMAVPLFHKPREDEKLPKEAIAAARQARADARAADT